MHHTPYPAVVPPQNGLIRARAIRFCFCKRTSDKAPSTSSSEYGFQAGLRLPHLVATLDEPEVRHQVPQGRHGPYERPGRVLEPCEGGPVGEGPCSLCVDERAGARREADRKSGVRDQQGRQPAGRCKAKGLRNRRNRASLDRGTKESPVSRKRPVHRGEVFSSANFLGVRLDGLWRILLPRNPVNRGKRARPGSRRQNHVEKHSLKNTALLGIKNSHGPFAPAADLCVDVHRAPILGTVPSDPISAVIVMDLGGANRLGEVDQVYVLVAGPDVLELHPCGPVELDGVLYILALLPHELDLDTRLLHNLAHSRLVGKFIWLYMTTRRKPHRQLAVEVQEHFPLPHHEHSHRKMPARSL